MQQQIPLYHGALRRFVDSFAPGAPIKAVPLALKPPYGPTGNCYWNVAKMVELYGGAVVHGWEMAYFPKRYIQAAHHAVWQSPRGALQDVTVPCDWRPGRTTTTFVPDESVTIDLERLPMVACKLEALEPAQEVDAFIRAYIELNKVEKEIGAVMHQAGSRCEGNFAVALAPTAPLPPARISPLFHQRLIQLSRDKQRLSEVLARCRAAL